MRCQNCGRRIEEGTKLCADCQTAVMQSSRGSMGLLDSLKEREIRWRKRKRKKLLRKMVLFLSVLVLVVVVGLVVFGRTKTDLPETASTESLKALLEESTRVESLQLPDGVDAVRGNVIEATGNVSVLDLAGVYAAVAQSEDSGAGSLEEVLLMMQDECSRNPEKYIQEKKIVGEVVYDGRQWVYDDLVEQAILEEVNKMLYLHMEDGAVLEMMVDYEEMEAEE